MMGKELGLSTLELRSLALGAQMHDVGKIGVPDRILTKPAKLTAEEFAIIKEHVEPRLRNRRYTCLALSARGGRHPLPPRALDGTGYPQRPQAARTSPSTRASSPSPTPSTP